MVPAEEEGRRTACNRRSCGISDKVDIRRRFAERQVAEVVARRYGLAIADDLDGAEVQREVEFCRRLDHRNIVK